MQQIGNPCKMDIMFYNSYKKAKKIYKIRLIYHFIRLLFLVVFLPIDIHVVKSNKTLIIAFLGTGIGICTINIFSTLMILWHGYSNKEQNNVFILNMAAIHDHQVTDEPIVNAIDLRDIKKCVSKSMYFKPNLTEINNEGLDEELKNKYENVFINEISGQKMQASPCLSIFESLSKLGSLGLIIFGIVALSLSKPKVAEIAVCSIYLFLEAFNVWIILLIFIGIALSPIIICVLCFAFCCCKKNPNQLANISAVQATAEMIHETDGTCSICLRDFELKKRVIVLPCSKKHMFHEGCLTNWFKIYLSCPICRHKLGDEVRADA